MMFTAAIVLACTAIAFICGAILGKAFSATRVRGEPVGREKLHALLETQKQRYRKRMDAMKKVIQHHEEARDQIREKFDGIEVAYEERGRSLQQAKTQLDAERQQVLDLRERLEQIEAGQTDSVTVSDERDQLRHDCASLKQQLEESTARLNEAEQLAQQVKALQNERDALNKRITLADENLAQSEHLQQAHDQLRDERDILVERVKTIESELHKTREFEKRNRKLSKERDQLAERVEHIEAELQESATLRQELDIASSERDKLNERVAELEENRQADEVQAAQQGEEKIAKLSAAMDEMRETLSERDRHVHDLELQLSNSEVQARELQEKLADWQQRIAPLTQQLKKQKELLDQIRSVAKRNKNRSVPADDLEAIDGIDTALARRLQQHGVRTFRQLAGMNNEQLVEVAVKLAIEPEMPARDAWISQAQALCEQREVPEPA